MSAAAKLRALRESLPNRPGVRAVAALLGYDMPNGYGYYESAQFKRDTLPLDKAREFAAAFVTLGGQAEDVLALAGLTDAEQVTEAKAVPVIQERRSLMLPVSLPAHDRLTRMMRGLLEGIGLPDVADQHAEELALQLPDALAHAASETGTIPFDRAANSPVPAANDAAPSLSRSQ